MEKTYHIAQFGTFDIESMGDSMFPKGLFYGITQYLPVEIELFSLNECAAPYNQNSHVYSFQQFAERHNIQPFDAVILGGGEILHFKKIDFMVNGEYKPYPAGFLWKKPIQMAVENKIPAIILNCVGVSSDFSHSEALELREYMKSVSLITVRDEFSKLRLLSTGISPDKVFCVADNLWYFNVMYPKHELDKTRSNVAEKTKIDFSSPYIIVQYGTTRNSAELTQQLIKIKSKTNYNIYLMAVNYCHEDLIGNRQLEAAGNGAFLFIDQHFQPKEMLSLIAGAKGFIGTSLHGNLTAASYGVPFIGIDMYSSFVSKMDGIFSMIDCEQYLVPNESGIYTAFDAFSRDNKTLISLPETIKNMQNSLDKHFRMIAQIIRKDSLHE